MLLGGSERDRGAETHFSHFISNRIHGDAFNSEYNFLDPKPVPGSLTSAQSKKQMNRMRNILSKQWRSRMAACCPFLKKVREIRGTMWMWGLGSLGVILIVSIMEGITGKLRRILLLHFGLVAYTIHFRKTRKPIMCMVL